MEPHETGVSHYYHQPHPPPTPTALPANANGAVNSGVPTFSASPASNGGLFSNHGVDSSDGAYTTAALYPQLLAGKAPTPSSDIVRKKRGRPRKYGAPEAAAAAKAAASAARSPNSLSSPPWPTSSSRKREHQVIGSPSSASSSLKKSQLDFEAKTGQCFMPHVVTVQPGEDVAHKIRIFLQQSNRELCILSASGSVCNVSLLQPATSGGSVTYDGPFDILSLSGSFVRRDHGERSGGLSACFSATNGQIVGGGLAGPLIAVGPVEVLVATFVINTKKDVGAATKGETFTTLASPSNSVSISTGGYRPVIDQSERYPVQGDDNHQNIGGFMIQHQGLHMVPSHSDWRGGPDTRNGFNYDFTGRTGQGIHESPENGDYEHLPD